MITDLRDLEPLLGQYDPGLLLVGPVLSFSVGGYRYFYIAANGSKVYETIGLGYFENEADAESQRANIVAILKSRFTNMQIFASHWEMAQAANTRWPNEETDQVLALAALLTEPESGVTARDGSIDDNSHTQVVLGDYGQQLVDDVAREPIGLANEAVLPSALPVDETQPVQSLSPPNMSANAPSSPGTADRPAATPQQGHSGRNDDDIAAILTALRPHNQSQSAPKLPAATTSSLLSGDRVVGEQQGHSERNDEDIAAILRALKPSHQSQNAPRLPSTTTRSPLSSDRVLREQQGQSERRGYLLAIMASFSRRDLDQNDDAATSRALGPYDRPQSVQWLKGAQRLATLLLLICAVGGASALLTWAMRPPSTPRQPAVATAPSSIVTRQTGSIKPAQVAAEQQTEVNGRTQQVEPAPAAMAPSPPGPQPRQQVEPAPTAMAPSPPIQQPSTGVSTQAEAAPDSGSEHQVMTTPVSGPQPSPAQGSSTALHVDSQEITTLIDRGSAYLKRGDLASARLLLRRAAEAGSANAALMLGSTFDPLIIRQLGVIGIEPDVGRARQWYEKAADLGSDAASQRLANLKNQ
jgi:Sel1 repeat